MSFSQATHIPTITITTSSGVGSTTFTPLINRTLWHILITTPSSVTTTTYTCYFTDKDGNNFHYFSGTGPQQFNDQLLLVNVKSFSFAASSVDGAFTVDLWIA